MTNITTNPFALGKVVPTPGTPANLCSNFPSAYGQPTPGANLIANQMQVRALPPRGVTAGNVGQVYIGESTMNKATLAGVLCVLQPGESISMGTPNAANTLAVGSYFVDSDTAGDGVYALIYIA